jgi:LacI family transcriptional regulator
VGPVCVRKEFDSLNKLRAKRITPVSNSSPSERKRVSIRDVATEAGVAVSSVSRVLTGAPSVSDKLRARVLEAVDTLGYSPNLLAQGLRSQSTRTIGFIVGDISNPLLSSIVCSAERVLRDAGYSVLLTISEGEPELDRAHIELFAQRRVDGLLLSLASEEHMQTYRALKKLSLPCVFIDRNQRRGLSAGAVMSDHDTGMRAAVDHLLDLGHRHLGLIVGAPVRPSKERAAALAEAFRHRRLPASYRVEGEAFTSEFGQGATGKLLDGPEPCTAIVFGGNQLFVGGLAEIKRRGLTVPRDLSIVCCDSTDLTEIYEPRLALISRDIAELGRQSAQLLLRILQGRGGRRYIELPTSFEAGETCAPPR